MVEKNGKMLWQKVESVIFNFYFHFHSLLTFISKTKICEPKTDVHKFTDQKKNSKLKMQTKTLQKSGVNW